MTEPSVGTAATYEFSIAPSAAAAADLAAIGLAATGPDVAGALWAWGTAEQITGLAAAGHTVDAWELGAGAQLEGFPAWPALRAWLHENAGQEETYNPNGDGVVGALAHDLATAPWLLEPIVLEGGHLGWPGLHRRTFGVGPAWTVKVPRAAGDVGAMHRETRVLRAMHPSWRRYFPETHPVVRPWIFLQERMQWPSKDYVFNESHELMRIAGLLRTGLRGSSHGPTARDGRHVFIDWKHAADGPGGIAPELLAPYVPGPHALPG